MTGSAKTGSRLCDLTLSAKFGVRVPTSVAAGTSLIAVGLLFISLSSSGMTSVGFVFIGCATVIRCSP